jgi:hypothetical protein
LIHQEQLYNSLLMLRRANQVNNNADVGMVALKNIND